MIGFVRAPRRRHRRRLGRATAAKYIRIADPSIEITLLEPNKEFISCPFSNPVLAGVESLKNLTMNYNGLKKYGVRIRHETAAAIEPDERRVRVGKDSLEYDRLIVSPGRRRRHRRLACAEVGQRGQCLDPVLERKKISPEYFPSLAEGLKLTDNGVVMFMLNEERGLPLTVP